MATLKKITKVKNLGVYIDLNSSTHPEFKRYNVIYGSNGTGKTTLSKLLGALNEGSHPEFPSLEYQVETSDQTHLSQGSKSTTPIRVFNRDFVEDNVDFVSSSSKSINVILGKANKETLLAIANDKKTLEEINATILSKTDLKKRKEDERGKEFTNIAKVIGQTKLQNGIRNYTKTHAENAFKKLGEKILLNQLELNTLSVSISQTSLPQQSPISIEKATKDLSDIVNDAETLLMKTVEAVVIERLKENSDISIWVEAGLKIYTDHQGSECEFCGNSIGESRIQLLTAHFNEADGNLKKDVDNLAIRLTGLFNEIATVEIPDKMNIYQDLRSEYSDCVKAVTNEREILLNTIKQFKDYILSKKLHTTVKLQTLNAPTSAKLVNTVDKLNVAIAKHNTITNDFEQRQDEAMGKIETHYLSTIFDAIQKFDEIIGDLKAELEVLSTNKKHLSESIAHKTTTVSSSSEACGILNRSLNKFLGHKEINFEVKDDGTGYIILRRGKIASNLSEGERTAIAFIFFITQLQDDNFDQANGIVVIDDPVSSLDSNSQFQAFSFLKESTKDASQLFVFTHNFDFLKLMLNWVKRTNNAGLFMVKNRYETDGSRNAYLDKLDKSLECFESEYHYLFNIIFKYRDDGTIENAYRIPNIARKLLESFLMFRVPKNVSTYQRLMEIEYDGAVKTAIYKFVNDQSHITGAGFDPSLVSEAQKCVKYLLEMMKAVDEKHYNYLVESAG